MIAFEKSNLTLNYIFLVSYQEQVEGFWPDEAQQPTVIPSRDGASTSVGVGALT